MGQIQLITSLVLIGLFSVAIIGFAINFAIDNNSAVDIRNDSEISNLYVQQGENISSFKSAAESQQNILGNTTIEPGSDVAQSTGPFSITFGTAIQVFKNVLEVGYVKIFGTNSGFNIFLGTLIAMILFISALFLYKTLKGQPD